MDTQTLIITIILNVLITATSYLAVPILLCTMDKKFSHSTIKKIVTINGAVVCLIFIIIKATAGTVRPSAAVFLWSSVGYFILKKGCLNTSDTHTPKSEETHETNEKQCIAPSDINTPQSEEIHDTNKKYSLSWDDEQPNSNGIFYSKDIYFQDKAEAWKPKEASIPKPIEKQPPKRHNKKGGILATLLILSAALLFVSLNFNILQYNTIAELKEDKESSEKETLTEYNDYIDLKKDYMELKIDYTKLENDINIMSDKVDFYDESIVFVIEGYGDYYFTYDEVIEVTDGEEFSYWAYNKELAIDLGYTAYSR